MDFLNISKEKQEVIVRLHKNELVGLSNVLYMVNRQMIDDEVYHKIYGDIILARNLASYGHIDEHVLDIMSTQRRYVKKINKEKRR